MTCSIRHSLPFEQIPAIMCICMVLHAMQFMNSFPQKGGLKHYLPNKIMNGTRRLHMNHLQLKFGNYCQVAEDVTPCNSLATRTRGAVSMGPSGNLSGGQRCLTLDTGKLIVRNCWKELPMPLAIIDRVNVLGHTKWLMLVLLIALALSLVTTHLRLMKLVKRDESAVNDLYSSIPSDPSGMPGVSLVDEGSTDEIQGVDLPDVAVVNESTGEWIWVVLKLPPLKTLCLTMLFLIRH